MSSSSSTAMVPDYNTSTNSGALIVANQALTASNNATNTANSANTTSTDAYNLALNYLGTSQSALIRIPNAVSVERVTPYVPTNILTTLLTTTFNTQIPNAQLQMWGNVNVTDTSGGSTINLRLKVIIGTINYAPYINFNLTSGSSYTIPLSCSPITPSNVGGTTAQIEIIATSGTVVVSNASLTVIY